MAANPTIRAFAFYWRDKKAATVHQQSLKIMPGRTAQFGHEGYLAHSKGAVQVQIEISEVVPVAGSTTMDDIDKILAQQDIDCAILIAGKAIRVTMAVTGAEYSSDTEKGVATGKITLEGGVPKVVG